VVIGQGVVLCAEPVVEAVVVGLRLNRWFVEGAIQMPLANVGSAVTGTAEERGDGDFAGAEVHR